jgi:L-fuculokinase
MRDDLVLVLDCGSTNIRAVAINAHGELKASARMPNGPVRQPGGRPEWLIWDLRAIWNKIAEATRGVSRKVGADRIRAVTLTTWGADGAPVSKSGDPTYPPISWQCPRTIKIAEGISETISPWELYRITGYQVISFNTLLKLIWLRENEPRALDRAHTWLMMPGLLAFKLTGEFHIDQTSASTTMALDLSRRDWSKRLLGLAGLDPGFFPDWKEPGGVIGEVTSNAGRICGLKSGTPVIAAGHDTQFALLGSGARPGEAILSSGTWEILEVRVPSFRPNREGFRGGMVTEADAESGLWNPQLLMMGSAVLEWTRERLYSDMKGRDYGVMIGEAAKIPPGSEGVTMVPSFVPDSGPTRRHGTKGTMLGLSLKTSRAHIYRSALEGLSYQLRTALEVLGTATRFRAQGIRVVGGGSKNDLWNQIRADVTGLPITVTRQKEATVIGAAMTAFMGVGRYGSLKGARSAIKLHERHFRPSADRRIYEVLYPKFRELPVALKSFYRSGSDVGDEVEHR